MLVELKDGSTVNIYNQKAYLDTIEEQCGYDMRLYAEKQLDIDTARKIWDSRNDNWEICYSEATQQLNSISLLCSELLGYLDGAKKINRNTLYARIKGIKNQSENW